MSVESRYLGLIARMQAEVADYRKEFVRDGRASRDLSRDAFGQLLAVAGDWKKGEVPDDGHYHSRADWLKEPPWRGRHAEISIPLRAIARVFTFVAPTKRMFELCVDLCDLRGVKFVLGELVFTLSTLHEPEDGHRIVRIDLQELLAKFPSPMVLAQYAAYGILAPPCLKALDDFFGEFMGFLQDSEIDEVPLLRGITEDAITLQHTPERSSIRSPANWERHFKGPHQLRTELSSQCLLHRIKWMSSFAANYASRRVGLMDIGSITNLVPRNRLVTDEDSQAIEAALAKLAYDTEIKVFDEVEASFAVLRSIDDGATYGILKKTEPAEKLDLKELEKRNPTYIGAPEFKWRVDPVKFACQEGRDDLPMGKFPIWEVGKAEPQIRPGAADRWGWW